MKKMYPWQIQHCHNLIAGSEKARDGYMNWKITEFSYNRHEKVLISEDTKVKQYHILLAFIPTKFHFGDSQIYSKLYLWGKN